MPSKKQYDLVQNDDYDTRIPLHPEEAFHHGITFQAKKQVGNVDENRDEEGGDWKMKKNTCEDKKEAGDDKWKEDGSLVINNSYLGRAQS
ncbi:phosphotyrosine interaction domain-containing family member [Holotrichia oblita]|uniref:Phosphotyrosine interaction domain-containing family member n=1 Tax=Holotrichia oblita TaxID=644536 RepID=A0ACB9TYJ4_HOLOL|nr:phosphotyrosine interaction domain-containing family member [Holotrichia oblita]